MTRFEDWPNQLNRFVADWLGKKHVWGASDCSIMCLDWVERATGRKVGEDVAGSYDSAAGALNFLAENNYEDLGDMVTDRLGSEPIDRAFLQRGDIALVDCPKAREGIGVVTGSHILIVDIKQGGSLIPLSRAIAGWRL
ncbi:hypothetical protein WH95_18595 [Kiloniella litopenaei]|uniref:DUF6950 domain-containing protein n=1 Tax=Kiloniella litopenaei TaxID=1549748 RepID=A0A0M2R623_9PROT|nr:hypothetical protein [Kiloniella litopenaei]KKJ75450.1 hypothetical protein WH95_18595 [Kiloniella litopenaei]